MQHIYLYCILVFNKGDIISNQANDYNKVIQILT